MTTPHQHPYRRTMLVGVLVLTLLMVYWYWPDDNGRDLRYAVYRQEYSRVERMLRKHPELVNEVNLQPTSQQPYSKPPAMNFAEEFSVYLWEVTVLRPARLADTDDEFERIEDARLAPLMIAVVQDDVSMARHLIEQGAKMHQGAANWDHPIYFAASRNAEMLKLFLQYGVPVTITNRAGTTPLHGAVYSHETATTRVLLEAGANPNLQDMIGRTPLHNVVHNPVGQDIVKLLLQYGAKVEITNKAGRTALDEALKWGNSNIVHALTLPVPVKPTRP